MEDFTNSFYVPGEDESMRLRRLRRKRSLQQEANTTTQLPKTNVALDASYPAQEGSRGSSYSGEGMGQAYNLISNLFNGGGAGSEFYTPANFGTFPEAGIGAEEVVLGGGGEEAAAGGGSSVLGGLGWVAIPIAATAAREYLGSNGGTQVFSGSIHEDWHGIGNMLDNFWPAIGEMFEGDIDLASLSEPGFWTQFGFPLGYGSGMGGWDPYNDVLGWFGMSRRNETDSEDASPVR